MDMHDPYMSGTVSVLNCREKKRPMPLQVGNPFKISFGTLGDGHVRMNRKGSIGTLRLFLGEPQHMAVDTGS